jgi:hypothetical protein
MLYFGGIFIRRDFLGGACMDRRRLSFIGLIILFVSIIVYVVWSSYDMPSASSFSKDNTKQVVKDVEKLKKIEEESYERIQMMTSDDIGYLPYSYEEIMKKYQTKKGLIEYFAASLFLDNRDLFLQSFAPEVISKDLFSEKEENKYKVIGTFMDAIRHNNTLTEVGYKTKSNMLGGQEDNKITLVLKYGDRSVEIEVELKTMKDYHGTDFHSIYVINTSVKDIIRSIEKELS